MKVIILAVIGVFISHLGYAQTIVDSVATYSHHTIANHVTVRGRDTLNVRDVIVMPNGKLNLISPHAVVIQNNFQVKQGGVLSIETNRSYRIRYTYDAAGNRTRRDNE